MIKIYSEINTEHLLHIIYRLEDFKEGRENIISEDQFIQCSALNLEKGTTFKPHQHKYHAAPNWVIAQESWHILKGEVKFIYYDTNGKLLGEYHLHSGDTSFTLEGGHTYEIIENAIILEYKTGPYLGQSSDKTFI